VLKDHNPQRHQIPPLVSEPPSSAYVTITKNRSGPAICTRLLRGREKEREGRVDDKLVLMLDNASIHRTKLVKQVMDKWGVNVLFTCPTSPQGSPVERLFREIKRGQLMTGNRRIGKR